MNRRMVLFASLILATAALVFAQEYDAESDFGVSRTEDGKSVIITGYAGSKQVVNIPPKIRNLLVTVIGDGAFKWKELKGITIPNSVTIIGNEAFSGNELTNITIPDSVTIIGEKAFEYNKLTSVTIGNKVTSIGSAAFWNNQLNNITIGNKVTFIGLAAFFENQLSNVTIPNSVNVIERDAFGRNPLIRITIGKNVKCDGEIYYDFSKFYTNQQKSRAGTYVFNENNGSWSEEW